MKGDIHHGGRGHGASRGVRTRHPNHRVELGDRILLFMS
jgi:hypothetical protein